MLTTTTVLTRVDPEAKQNGLPPLQQVAALVAELIATKQALEQETTARKLAEQALREATEQLRALIAATPLPTFLWDLETLQYLAVNEAAVFHSGYSREELLTMRVTDLLPPEAAPGVLAHMQTLRAEPRDHGQGLHRLKDGRVVDVEADLTALEFRGRRAVLGVIQDVTERKRTEQDLLASEMRCRSYVESAPYGVFITDEKGRYLEANAEACLVTGYSEAELLTMSIPDLLPPESLAEGAEHFGRVMASGESRGELKLLTKSGEARWWSVAAVKLSDTRVMGFTNDITEQKRAEEKLKVTLADLERSNQELEQFAYVASHDLQEPLRMVSSYTQLLARRYQGKLGADADEFIAYAVDGASRMQGLITDLLAYSRVGTRTKGFELTDCQAVLDLALANLRAAIDTSGAVVTHELLPTVMADRLQLVQLFQNLVGNAIKFHVEEPPRIHVSAEKKAGEWEFLVRDNGIGIDPQYAERIFVIFQRLHTREEYSGGTGIGLAICKKIVERRGGRIWVESQLGKGSTFHFTILTGGNEP